MEFLKKKKKILLQSISYKYFGASKLNHFGYPITTVADNRYSMYEVKDLKDFQDKINRNIIKMDLYNEDNYPDEPKPEVELFFDKNGYGTRAGVVAAAVTLIGELSNKYGFFKLRENIFG